MAAPFNYRYPLSKLESSDDYLKIDIVKYTPPGVVPEGDTLSLPSASDKITAAIAGDITNILGTIILPIPDSVADSNKVQWGPSSLNPIQAAVVAGGAGLLNTKSVDDFKEKVKLTTDKYFGAAMSGTAQKYGQALAISMAANAILGKSDSNIPSRYAGVVANSNIELVFSGVNLRDGFSFGFDITPRSQDEALAVKEIIRKFKSHSAAKRGKAGQNAAGLFLQAPEVFRIQYMCGSKPHPYLNKFKICALLGMSVDYAPGGVYATYSDGAPVNIQLGLSFQELTPIYAEDYESDIGAEGVGF